MLFFDDANEALDRLRAENPTCRYKISPDGILQRDFGYNVERYRTVCTHNQEARACRIDVQCHDIFKKLKTNRPLIGRPLPSPGPMPITVSDPTIEREHKEAPYIPANLTETERGSYRIILMQLSEIVPNTTMDKHCIIYKGGVMHDGTGMMLFRGKTIRVSVLSYILTHNRLIPENFIVRHICTTKGCFEPSHLEIGTQRQNMFEDRIRDNTLPNGESHHMATLTNAQVLEIFHNANNETRQDLADRFHTSASNIKNIQIGYAWSHVTGYHAGSKRRRENSQLKRDTIQRKDATPEYYQDCLFRIREKAFIDQRAPACINCSYALDASGYHAFGMLGHTTKVHVVVWEYHHNDCKIIPEGMVVRHMCNNAWCINPEHLQIGTPSDNMYDRYRK
jgi:HNH endonuclease